LNHKRNSSSSAIKLLKAVELALTIPTTHVLSESSVPTNLLARPTTNYINFRIQFTYKNRGYLIPPIVKAERRMSDNNELIYNTIILSVSSQHDQ
jgi:hypothetical protein